MSVPGDSRVTRGGQRPPPYAPPHKVFFGVGAPKLPPPGAPRPLPAPTVLLMNGAHAGARNGDGGVRTWTPPPILGCPNWGRAARSRHVSSSRPPTNTTSAPRPQGQTLAVPAPCSPWVLGAPQRVQHMGGTGGRGGEEVLGGLSPRSERLLHAHGVRVMAWWDPIWSYPAWWDPAWWDPAP